MALDGMGTEAAAPPPELAGSGAVFDRIQCLARALFPGRDSHQAAQYALAGVDNFVAKPIEAARLDAVIEAALTRAEEARWAAA